MTMFVNEVNQATNREYDHHDVADQVWVRKSPVSSVGTEN